MIDQLSDVKTGLAREDHLGEITRLEQRLFRKGDRFSEARFRYLLLSPNSRFFVCLQDHRCIGYGIALRNKLRNGTVKGRIYSLAVVPDWWNRGIGSLLLSRMEKWLSKQKVSFITLETPKTNDRARNLYEGRGYQVTEVLQAYYAAGDGVRMRKTVRRRTPA